MTNPTEDHNQQARVGLPLFPTLYAMFEEWRTSFPLEHQPERDAPQTEQLIDAWIAGFAKHNEITCTAQSALATKDTEVREVLEGLRYSEVGWCWCKGPGRHSKACEATRALYATLQPKESE